MATYLMSDIHGDYDGLLKMLGKIEFTQDDKLYILGDAIDRGPDGLKVISYIRDHDNVVLIKGNHEMFLQYYMEGKLEERKYALFGGRDTILSLRRVAKERRNELLQYLKSLPYQVEIETHYGATVLCHVGVHLDYLANNADGTIDVVESVERAAHEDEWFFLTGEDIHNASSGDLKKLDHFMVIGHTPVVGLQGGDNHILHHRYYMDIDCGAGHRKDGGVMACYRVEDGAEFYC